MKSFQCQKSGIAPGKWLNNDEMSQICVIAVGAPKKIFVGQKEKLCLVIKAIFFAKNNTAKLTKMQKNQLFDFEMI
jgi:hypothetical protein